MAETNNGSDGATEAAAGQDKQPQVGVLAQYVKDLSFENPNAPQVYQEMKGASPQIDVNVNVSAKKITEENYEVELKISATALQNDKTAFIVELVYAGLIGLRNLPPEAIQPFLLIQTPIMLFPYARRVISDATRDGGFPPLMLEPMDFNAMYQQSIAQQGQAAPEAAN